MRPRRLWPALGLLVSITVGAYVLLRADEPSGRATETEAAGVLAPGAASESELDSPRVDRDVRARLDGPDGGAAEPTSPSCSLVTLDDAGASIAHATVWVTTELGVRELGSTNELGILALDVAEVEGRELWAQARRHAARGLRVEPNACAAGELELVLPRAATLHGSVWHRGAPRPNARVVAWPAGVGPSCERLRSAAPNDPRLLQTISDSNGQFEIDGVERGREYHVVAAVAGLVTRQKARHADLEVPLELELVELYGARLVVVERGGAPVRAAPGWFDPRAEEWTDRDELADLVDGREAVCLLALDGIPAVETRFDWLRSTERRGLHAFDFVERAAHIVGLSPGEYEVALCRPGDPQRPDLAPFRALATVRPGEEATIELVAR